LPLRQSRQNGLLCARSFNPINVLPAVSPSHLIDQLRELAEAEPFKRFAINMRSGKSYLVNRRADIGFTDHGNPQVRLGPSELPVPASKLHVGLLAILNVDAIDEIILL
jgi:hypothetical protein